jgi:hypothetical protein
LANGSAIFDGGEAPAALTALLADLPRSTSAIVFIGGIMIGAWTDCLFRTFEDKRRNAGKGLGAQLTRLGNELARLEFSGARTLDWPKNLGTARLGVARALVRMLASGIPALPHFRFRGAASFWSTSFARSGLCFRASALRRQRPGGAPPG